MATLNVKARDGEIIRLPLTTRNQSERALAIRHEGIIYRCPLVQKDDPLASAVRIRWERTNNAGSTTKDTFALSKSADINPVTHDSAGIYDWECHGTATILNSGFLMLNGGYLKSTTPITFPMGKAFEIFIPAIATTVDKKMHTLVELYSPVTGKSLSVVINTANKASVLLNKTAIKTESVISSNTLYRMRLTCDSANTSIAFSYVGETQTSVSKSVPEGDYYCYIGYSPSSQNYFYGRLIATVCVGKSRLNFGG